MRRCERPSSAASFAASDASAGESGVGSPRDVLDDAERAAFALEHRTLLDVQLEHDSRPEWRPERRIAGRQRGRATGGPRIIERSPPRNARDVHDGVQLSGSHLAEYAARA